MAMDIQEYKTSINHYTVPVIWMQNRDSKKKKPPKKRTKTKLGNQNTTLTLN